MCKHFDTYVHTEHLVTRMLQLKSNTYVIFALSTCYMGVLYSFVLVGIFHMFVYGMFTLPELINVCTQRSRIQICTYV